MDNITATIEENYIENEQQVTLFRIAAVNKSMARRRVRVAARVKGLNNPSVGPAEKVRDSDNPGQTMYEVAVTSER